MHTDTTHELCELRAVDHSWVRYFGGLKLIIADGELGLDSEEARQWLDRISCDV